MLNNGTYPISKEEAIQIALKRVPGKVVGTKIVHEHGIASYEFDIKTPSGVGYEVQVNATTGKILKAQIDND